MHVAVIHLSAQLGCASGTLITVCAPLVVHVHHPLNVHHLGVATPGFGLPSRVPLLLVSNGTIQHSAVRTKAPIAAEWFNYWGTTAQAQY